MLNRIQLQYKILYAVSQYLFDMPFYFILKVLQKFGNQKGISWCFSEVLMKSFTVTWWNWLLLGTSCFQESIPMRMCMYIQSFCIKANWEKVGIICPRIFPDTESVNIVETAQKASLEIDHSFQKSKPRWSFYKLRPLAFNEELIYFSKMKV